MLKRQYIVTVGWERCLVFYEDAKSDKRPVKPCRIVPDARAGQLAAALNQGHTSDILTAAMQVKPRVTASSAHAHAHLLVMKHAELYLAHRSLKSLLAHALVGTVLLMASLYPTLPPKHCRRSRLHVDSQL